MSGPGYLLHAEEGWYMYLGGLHLRNGDRLLADGDEMTAAARRGWWLHSGSRPKRIECHRGERQQVVHYDLPVGVGIVGASHRLTPAEHAALNVDASDDPLAVARAALYHPVTEPFTPDPEPVAVPTVVLDGAPEPDDGLAWVGDLPHELREHPEYLHLFPGRLDGFAEAVTAALDEIPGVHAFYSRNAPAHVSVRVEAQFDPPQHAYRKSTSGRGKPKLVETRRQRTFDLHPPARIEAQTRAKAVARWRTLLGEYRGAVEAVTVTACGHCGGSGLADLPDRTRAGWAAIEHERLTGREIAGPR